MCRSWTSHIVLFAQPHHEHSGHGFLETGHNGTSHLKEEETDNLPCCLSQCSQAQCCCAGLRNLIMVLFAATTLRLMLENFIKYGIRINPKNWVLAVVTPEGGVLFHNPIEQKQGLLVNCNVS